MADSPVKGLATSIIPLTTPAGRYILVDRHIPSTAVLFQRDDNAHLYSVYNIENK